MRRLVFALGLAVAATSLAPRALADDADEADVEFQIGADKYKAGDWLGALEHFLASNRLAPNHNVVFNVARCYERLERFPDAYRYYVLAESPQNTAERRASIEEAIARIVPKIAILEVKTDPPGATLYLDRKELGARGTSPRSLGLAAGTYTVIAELADHEAAVSAPTTVTVGKTTTVTLSLVPMLATIDVAGDSVSGAEVRVDDSKAPSACTAPCALHVSSGHHTLFFTRAGSAPADASVDVAPRGTVTLSPKLAALTGSVVVESDVKDSLIEVDGKPIGFTPAVLSLPIGVHALRVSHAGYRAHAETVMIGVEGKAKLDVELVEALEVGAASRKNESAEDAPASISIIPKYELVGMGYPTIAEALRGVRGVFVDDDRSYQSVGIRGFGRPGEYGSHVLVLVDGHPTNENDTGGAAVGFDARTDLDDVERIEIVRGPGSALYGSAAFFGVINLVTRGRDEPTHVEAGMSAVEYGVLRGRVHATYRIDDDAGFWISLSGARSPNGRDFYFDEYAADGNGFSLGNDGLAAGTVTGRAWYKTVTAQWMWTDRTKRIPTGVSQTTFPSPFTEYEDRHGFFEVKIEPKIGDVLWITRAHANTYLYDDTLDYPLAANPDGTPTGGRYYDAFRGAWFGLEERFLIPVGEKWQLTLGGEGQYHALARQRSATQAGELLLNRNDPYTVGAGYVVADWTPSREVKLSPAVRLDHYSTTGGVSLNPRLAFVLHPGPDTTAKVVAGKAFRAPSVYELFYQSNTQLAPDTLKPENVYSGEIELTQRFSKVLSATLAGYADYVTNLIELAGGGTTDDPNVYVNSSQPILATGVEAEVRRDFRRWMFAAQVSLQRTRYLAPNATDGHDPRLDHVGHVPNSPNVLASLKAAVPIVQRTLVLTTRLSFVGPRWDRADHVGDPPQQQVDAAAIWDLVFTGEAEHLSIRYGIGVYNVLDARWFVPISPEYRMRTMLQNGRTLYASLGISF